MGGSAGLGEGLACATTEGDELGEGECGAYTLEGPGRHAARQTSTAARPAIRPILES